ncbi:MAG: hypothetical protein JW819_04695 [Candidatus Krumholzibacteriota bacterium]|nr:hypothetical protein [Candidatus Krumholzibacteriota bacterium]
MKRCCCTTALVVAILAISAAALSAPVVYNDEAAFRTAAGTVTTYGFETHGLVEGTDYSGSSPILAGDLSGHFDLAFTGLNLFEIIEDAGGPGVADGTRTVFTHSIYPGTSYTLTFSNFAGAGESVRMFGITIIDFASNITDPATITYDTGTSSGTLLYVPGGQPDYTQNFVGIIADASEAFTSITLTMDDTLSGFQYFDEAIYRLLSVAVESSNWSAIKALY